MTKPSTRADRAQRIAGVSAFRRITRCSAVIATALLLAATVWTVATARLVQKPHLDPVVRSDAVVVLGEPDAAAMRRAHELLKQGVSSRLVLIIPYGAPPDCAHPPTGVTVTCVVPDPSTTQGDARAIGRLAREHHLGRIVVITWPTHISRSRMLIQRCYAGKLVMTGYRHALSSRTAQLHEQLYQSVAYLKASLVRGC